MIVATKLCFGQSMFFDNLNNSTWTSASNINDLTIRNAKEIPLGKLRYSKDSLKTNVTIWSFRDEILTIHYYDYTLRKDSLIATYKYKTDHGKTILRIILNDNKTLNFRVGIASTGSFALLIRKKEKKKK